MTFDLDAIKTMLAADLVVLGLLISLCYAAAVAVYRVKTQPEARPAECPPCP